MVKMRDIKGGNNVLIEFGRRMREIRDQLKISQIEFAKKLEVSNSFISEIEYGKTKPGLLLFIRMADIFKVNPTWLLLGQGKVFLNDSENNTEQDLENLSESEKSAEKICAQVICYCHRL